MSATLITGADGHIGKALASWLLENSDDELLLFVRGDKREQLGALTTNARCRIFRGDLRDSEPFAEIGGADVAGILHCAAVTDFGIDRDTAKAVNVDGTDKLMRFAASCDRLRRFGFLSSLYAAGLRAGEICERPCDDSAPFANHYEWSKWQAERLVRNRRDIPWQIYRVATILGEDASGTVMQQNVIHNTLRLLYYGLLSVIPGDPRTRVYLVTTEFVSNAIGQLYLDAKSHETYHVSDDGDSAMTLGEIADAVYETFLRDPRFARQRVLKPLFCDQESFATLVRGIGQFGGAVSQALESVAPFAPQLYSDKDVRTSRSTEALSGMRAPDSSALLSAVASRLVETRWGLKQ